MQSWMNFWSLLFWLSFISFISNLNNFFRLLFLSEIVWVVLYVFVLICSVTNDDLTLLSSGILVLGLAGLEYAVGIMLIIIFKNFNNKLELEDIDNFKKSHHIFNQSNSYISRYVWESSK